MKILILNWRDLTHPKSGGAERVTMEHAKSWAKMGHNVVWLTAGYASSQQEEQIDGVTIIRRGGSMTIYPYAMRYILLQGNTYDVIVDEFHGLPFFSPLLTKTPIVAFIHEVAGDIWDYTFSFPLNKIGKVIEQYSFLLYKKIPFWTDAPSMVPELKKYGIDSDRIYPIPCPIPGNPKRYLLKKESNLTCIFVSRLVPMKGIEAVLQAFADILKEKKNAILWIIGKGDIQYETMIKYKVEIMSLASHVEFLGHVTDKEKYERMARAHVLLHASIKEGWGLVVLEAAFQGTPSIVYNVPGLCDVVKDGITGVVLKHNRSKDLAKETLALFHDNKRYETYQKNGIKWAQSLSWDIVTNDSIKLLHKVANPETLR